MTNIPAHIIQYAKDHGHRWIDAAANWKIYSRVNCLPDYSSLTIDQGIDLIYYKGDFNVLAYAASELGIIPLQGQVLLGNRRLMGSESNRAMVILSAPELPILNVGKNCSAWLYDLEQDDISLCLLSDGREISAQGKVDGACLLNDSSGQLLCKELMAGMVVVGSRGGGKTEASASRKFVVNTESLDDYSLFWADKEPVMVADRIAMQPTDSGFRPIFEKQTEASFYA